MRIVTNSRLIRRNGQIAKYASPASIVLLGVSLFILLRLPDRPDLGMITALLAFAVYPISMSYTNRWGRRPRPDEIVDRSLKGLDREYTIYHYSTPVHHLLVGPAGIWVLLPYYQAGILTYEKGRFRLRGGGFAQGYLRLLGSDALGRPELEAEADAAAVRRFLKRGLPDGVEPPAIQAALVFANPRLQIQVTEAPVPALAAKDLKDFIRRQAREAPLPKAELEAVRRALPEPQATE